MRFSVLKSSSSGNATYLEINNQIFMLDAGISARGYKENVDIIGGSSIKIDALFITHEHYDHISGLLSIYKKYRPMIYITKKTYNKLSESIKNEISPINFKFLEANKEYEIGQVKVETFKTNHDAIDSIGFIFNFENKSLCYLTDTGCFTDIEKVSNKTAYILESNHEPNMLEMSGRPWCLINRILSDHGHLSNQDSASLFEKIRGENTKTLVLFHLSNECNTKELALLAYDKVLKENKIKVYVSDRCKPTNLIEI